MAQGKMSGKRKEKSLPPEGTAARFFYTLHALAQSIRPAKTDIKIDTPSVSELLIHETQQKRKQPLSKRKQAKMLGKKARENRGRNRRR